MLHGIKMGLSGQNGKSLIESDECLKKSGMVVSDLQSWFPQLQAAIEENEKTWSSLGYNMKKVASTSQEIYGEGSPMQIMLEGLQVAGSRVIRPDASDNLSEERSKSAADLRAFNERIRGLRQNQEDCLATMKNKVYYQEKVETMRKKENEKSAKKRASATEKEAEKRLRNEQKLTEVSTKLCTQIDNLSRELDATLSKKEEVLAKVLNCYIHTQNYFFARNPMPAVLANMPSLGSPQSVHQATNSGHLVNSTAGFPPDTYEYAPASAPPGPDPIGNSANQMTQPPRAPSPDSNHGLPNHGLSKIPSHPPQLYNPAVPSGHDTLPNPQSMYDQQEMARRRTISSIDSLSLNGAGPGYDQQEMARRRSSLDPGTGMGYAHTNTQSIYPSNSAPQQPQHPQHPQAQLHPHSQNLAQIPHNSQPPQPVEPPQATLASPGQTPPQSGGVPPPPPPSYY